MKKLFLFFLLLNTSIFANKINIAVAANVSYAIDSLIKKFNEKNPDIKVLVTLGGSGKLTAQIKNGASYDVFMSANMKYPTYLFENNLATSKPTLYAQGSLAILSYKARNFSKGIKLINESEIEKIAIANPKTAPYGKASLEAIKNAKLYGKVSNKFIYAESISQTVAYTITATDLGFIAKSSLYSKKMKKYKKGINWIDVDTKLYTPINQGIVLLKNGKNKKEAKVFYDFILSEDAKKIFETFGYLVP